MSNPDLDLKSLPPERMLAELVQRLQEKVDDWSGWDSYDYCYCAGECHCGAATAEAKKEAYDNAADDLRWVLRAFGLERKD